MLLIPHLSNTVRLQGPKRKMDDMEDLAGLRVVKWKPPWRLGKTAMRFLQPCIFWVLFMVNSIKRDRNPWTFCKLSTCQTQMLVSHVDLQTYIYLPTQYLFWRAFVLAHCTKHEGWSNNLDNPGSQHEHQVAWYTERFMQMHLGNPTKKKMCWWVIMGHFPKTGGPAIIRKIGTRRNATQELWWGTQKVAWGPCKGYGIDA